MHRWDITSGDEVVGHIAVVGLDKVEIQLTGGSVQLDVDDAHMFRLLLGQAIVLAQPDVEPVEQQPLDPEKLAQVFRDHGLPIALLEDDEGMHEIGPDGFPVDDE